MIKFDSVVKRYPDGTVAVNGLDLVAPSGQITVFVGPSGCGKTTSLRMINRMIEPTSGTIWLDDQDTGTLDAASMRRGIGYVIQHAGLFPHRTIVDNIATVPYLLGWDKKKARARSMELMERVGLSTSFAKRYPAQLSGGQQQRVGVARALAADPPVMLMDEPFSAVDPVVREELQNEFLRLQSELGKTIVFVTHDIDEAVKLGDQVAVLKVGGTLAQLASPATLLSDPVDDFVAGFVGRDRGYRSLGFEPAGDLIVHEEKTVAIGDDGTLVQSAALDGWALALDDGHRPQGWVNASAVPAGRTVGPTLLQRGGTVAVAGGTLRAALDATLSSPSGRGVLVDENGAFLGTLRAAEVIARIEREHESRRASSSERAAQ
jgi:osmoprotectant transport system ATP-binding protein